MSDTLKPIGTIKVMGEWEENGIITVDVNDDVYKDKDGRCLQTTVASDMIYDYHGFNKEPIENFIERNRNNLTWTIAHA